MGLKSVATLAWWSKTDVGSEFVCFGIPVLSVTGLENWEAVVNKRLF